MSIASISISFVDVLNSFYQNSADVSLFKLTPIRKNNRMSQPSKDLDGMASEQKRFPRIIGIDPGLGGAIAILDDSGLSVRDIPIHNLVRGGKNKREMDVTEFARLIDAANPIDFVFVEKVGSMPGQGVSSVFAFGKVYGQILGVLAAHFIPVTLVPPQSWKRLLKVPAAKDGARARASELMPRYAGEWSRVKDDGRAEASLIAYYGYESSVMKG